MEQQPFYIGQKVVCVNNKALPGRSNSKATWMLSEGSEYTVFTIEPGDCGLPPALQLSELTGYAFCSSRFAPLNPPRVSAIPELMKAPVEETLDVIKTKELV